MELAEARKAAMQVFYEKALEKHQPASVLFKEAQELFLQAAAQKESRFPSPMARLKCVFLPGYSDAIHTFEVFDKGFFPVTDVRVVLDLDVPNVFLNGIARMAFVEHRVIESLRQFLVPFSNFIQEFSHIICRV